MSNNNNHLNDDKIKILARNVNLFYGLKQALFDINIDFKKSDIINKLSKISNSGMGILHALCASYEVSGKQILDLLSLTQC